MRVDYGEAVKTVDGQGEEPAEKDSRVTPPEGPAETRQRILEAAVEEFVEEGYAGARVDRIAKSSGLNKQLIYRYFGNKHALYEAAFADLVQKIRSRDAESAGSADGGLDAGASVVRQMLGAGSSESLTRSMVRLLAWEGLSAEVTGPKVTELRRNNFRDAIAWVRKQQESGKWRDDVSAEHITALLMTAGALPFAMPDAFNYALDRDSQEVSAQLRNDWREFVIHLLRSV